MAHGLAHEEPSRLDNAGQEDAQRGRRPREAAHRWIYIHARQEEQTWYLASTAPATPNKIHGSQEEPDLQASCSPTPTPDPKHATPEEAEQQGAT